MTRVMLAALETFSLVGGIQNFNRRVISNLFEIAQEQRWAAPRIHLLRDEPADIPPTLAAHVCAAGASRGAFVRETLRAARSADQLLLGHINILPLACAAKALNPSLRLTLFVHGEEVWGKPGRRPARFYEPLLLRAVDQIAAVSQFTADVMARRFGAPPEKFVLYPNAVDVQPLKPVSPRSTDLVLAVARLGLGDRRKNIDVLIRAVAELSRRGKPVRLEVVGGGPLRPELERLTSDLGVASHVRFLGRIDDGALKEAYDRASVFALPSSQEGFGIVYLEAWRHQLPVICGMQGAAHEIVSDRVDGLVCDETHVEDLADKIAYMIDNPAVAAEYGRRGEEKVRTSYCNEVSKRNLLSLITAAPR